mmetsp:Transcript_34194/g.55840  ORF Transcript_34194/g.55840 Transcript_34194/m.55840 type:complete len:84 (-) Transcript_34194:46-297(-)
MKLMSSDSNSHTYMNIRSAKLNQTIQEAQHICESALYIRPPIFPPHHLELAVDRSNDASRRCGGCDGWRKRECIEMRGDIERL